ncbi:MAG: hypothetical protein KH304_18120, partial [Clostridium sp.]|nr:hypothetical protein [Clostridium sp.]
LGQLIFGFGIQKSLHFQGCFPPRISKARLERFCKDMDVLREVFSYPFMELAHPTGRKSTRL